MRALVSLRQAFSDRDLLANILAGPSWLPWRALLMAAMGESLIPEEREAFTRLTGRNSEPLSRVDEFWAIIGRRGGKSRAIACLAVYLATLIDYADCLVAGERGVVLVLATNVKQAQVVFRYIVAILEAVPALQQLIANMTLETVSLSNGIDIEIRAASFRGLRGVTCVAAICDEIAYWFSDESSRNPDLEILDSIRPALLTTDGLLAAIGSPYARRGELWSAYKRYHGPKGDPRIIVAKATSQEMNSTLPQAKLDRELERDEARARSEYFAEFRSDIEAFITLEAIDAVTIPDRLELPMLGSELYLGFVDPSGGSADSMTLAIAHAEDDKVILDCVREIRPPFSPDSVVEDFVKVLRTYRLSEVYGDRWGGEFVREQFEKRGISYKAAEKAKSDLYKELLTLVNSRRVELLDLPRLISQLAGLERRTARGGRDSIDHGPGGHDDVANCVAGVLVIASGLCTGDDFSLREFVQAFGPGGGYEQMRLGWVSPTGI